MKQILTIVKDCRDCSNYYFSERYAGGIVFRCEASKDKEERLIPTTVGDEDWIHKDCSLDDKK